MFRVWVLVALIWLVCAGGIWIAIWSSQLGQAGSELVARVVHPTPNYEAICAALRSARAAGIASKEIPAIPALEVEVKDGIGRVLAAPGYCLAIIAKEEGIGLIPVALRVVRSDGTKLRQIEARDGSLRNADEFTKVPVEEDTLRLHGSAMIEGLVFVFAVPTLILVFGYAIGWVANGFRSTTPTSAARREPRL
jgi:hypothetical protein